MSGGHFNHNEYILEDLSNAVAMCLGQMEHIGSYIDSDELRNDIVAYTKRLCDDLQRLYKAVKVLDYYVSGDTGEETFIEEMRTIYEDKPSENP